MYKYTWIRSGDYAKFPPQPPGSLVMWGTEWPKFNIVKQGKYFLWTTTSNSLTGNEEHGIPSQILKTIFRLHVPVIFRPQYVWFPVHLKGLLIPLWYETLVVNWQNWLFTLFHQSRSVLSPNPITVVELLYRMNLCSSLSCVYIVF